MRLTVDEAKRRAAQCLPGLLGLGFTDIEKGLARAQMAVRPELLAPNGFLHGGSVVGLADTACGFGALASLPEGAIGFTTIELKSVSRHRGTRRGDVRSTTQPWRPFDPGVGRGRKRSGQRAHAGAVSLHANDALSALTADEFADARTTNR